MMQKLDYRCLAVRCLQGTQCRRYLTGQAAKNCTVPIAAFDHRRTVEKCDGFLQRVSGPINVELTGLRRSYGEGPVERHVRPQEEKQ